MTLTALGLGDALENDVNMIAATAPRRLTALSTSGFTAHIFYRSQSL